MPGGAGGYLKLSLLIILFALLTTFFTGFHPLRARIQWSRWCASKPDDCFQLHFARWFGGRGPKPLSAQRQLLVVGTMGSGTTATASKLSALGIEIGHEASDTRVKRARDGTVSWAHGLRYLDLSADRRASTLARLCKGPRNGCWMPAFYDGGPLGHGFGCASAGAHVPVWDECWREGTDLAVPPPVHTCRFGMSAGGISAFALQAVRSAALFGKRPIAPRPSGA